MTSSGHIGRLASREEHHRDKMRRLKVKALVYPLAELVSDPIVNSKIRYDARTVGPMSKRPARAALRKAYWNIPFDTLKALEPSHAAFCLSSARVPQSNLMR